MPTNTPQSTIDLRFIGLPASYRRGIERACGDAGVALGDGRPVVLVRLDSGPESCSRIDGVVTEGVTVVALLDTVDAAGIAHAVTHGACFAGYDAEPEQVVSAITAALSGLSQVPLELVASLLGGRAMHGETSLTEEEQRWLVALAGGATVVKVAEDSGYSERALFRRLGDLYARLGVSNRAEAMVAAERLGLLSGPTAQE